MSLVKALFDLIENGVKVASTSSTATIEANIKYANEGPSFDKFNLAFASPNTVALLGTDENKQEWAFLFTLNKRLNLGAWMKKRDSVVLSSGPAKTKTE